MSWGSVIGAGIGAMTGRRDNKQAAKAARREQDWEREAAELQYLRQQGLQDDAQAFEAEQAASAMQFSERMASTQHQREIKDLYAAGLNPILSGTGGMGAAAPSGVAGHSSAGSAAKAGAARQQIIPTSQAVIAGAATGAQIEKTLAEVKNIEADTRNKEAQNPGYEIAQEQARRQTENIIQDTEVKRALQGKTNAEIEVIKEELNRVLVDIRLKGLQGDTEKARRENIMAQSGLFREQASAAGVEARTMQNIERMDLNEALKAAPALAPLIHLIKPLLMRGIK